MEMMVELPAHQPSTPPFDTDKLSYEIFSILESKFLFGYDHHQQQPPPPQPSTYEHKPPLGLDPKTQRGKVRLLSIDGGLTFHDAILAATSLTLLERRLRYLSSDPSATLSHFFDVAAGSGIGAILVSLLFSSPSALHGGSPLFSAHDIPRLLSDHRHLLWPHHPPSTALLTRVLRRRPGVSSATRAVEKLFRRVFGESLTLKDTLKPVLITCYDLTGSTPLLFSRADAIESEGFDFRLWEVCRATSAEPGRFEPARMRSVDGSTRFVAADGGLAAANPTASAITHVLHNKQEFPFVRGVEDLLVLSLGRGPAIGSHAYELDRVSKWRAKEWAGPVRDITGGASAELVDHAVGMAFTNNRMGSNYVRVQSDRVDPIRRGMEEATAAAEMELGRKNVENAMFGGRRIGEKTNAERLEWFAAELLLEHRRRDERIAPTVAFKQPPPPPLKANEDVGKL